MPESKISEDMIEIAAENVTKDATLTKADLQAGKNMMEMDPLYQRFIMYQSRIRDRERGEAELDVMYEREYNMTDGLYAELQRRLNLEDEQPMEEGYGSAPDTSQAGINYPGEALMSEAFREYLESDLWDGEHGEAVSFTEFLASKEWPEAEIETEAGSEDVLEETASERESGPAHDGADDFEGMPENDVQSVSGIDEITDDKDFSEFEDDFGEDYDEFGDGYAYDEEMPDEEFEVPDEFDVPDGIEGMDIDLRNTDDDAEDEYAAEPEQDVLPEDQEDFPELIDDGDVPDEPEAYEGLEESVAEYDEILDGDGVQEAQLISRDAPQPRFIEHESFQPHDILDEASLGMSLASGVVEIEEVRPEQPEAIQKQPGGQLQALYARQAVMDRQEEQENAPKGPSL